MYPNWSYPSYNPTYKRLTKSPGPPSRVHRVQGSLTGFGVSWLAGGSGFVDQSC